MIVISMLPHAGFGRNAHREDAPTFLTAIEKLLKVLVKSLTAEN